MQALVFDRADNDENAFDETYASETMISPPT